MEESLSWQTTIRVSSFPASPSKVGDFTSPESLLHSVKRSFAFNYAAFSQAR